VAQIAEGVRGLLAALLGILCLGGGSGSLILVSICSETRSTTWALSSDAPAGRT